MNLIEELNNHRIIGLDMDETLIEGPRSFILQQWVKENCVNKELWVITFRTGPYVAQVWPELARFGIQREAFAGMKALPPKIYTDYHLVKKGFVYKDTNPAKFERFLQANNLTLRQAEEKFNALTHWKGEACASVGATVLVDDLPNMVLPGCQANGVKFIHSFHL